MPALRLISTRPLSSNDFFGEADKDSEWKDQYVE